MRKPLKVFYEKISSFFPSPTVFWVVFFILFFSILKLSVFSLYIVSSVSMIPTLLSGDRLLCLQTSYGLRMPFSKDYAVTWGSPRRGDVVFLRTPSDEVFVKRVMGVPGDEIVFREGLLFINSESVKEISVENHPYTDKLALVSQENFQDAPSHLILRSRGPDRTFFETRRFVVPAGQYFVLGDNRDNSFDSRNFGYISHQNIIGRAGIILFSFRKQDGFPRFEMQRFLRAIN